MEWIKTEDRLPEEYEKVLTYRPRNKFTKTELVTWLKGDELSGITHWMPLPEAPE